MIPSAKNCKSGSSHLHQHHYATKSLLTVTKFHINIRKNAFQRSSRSQDVTHYIYSHSPRPRDSKFTDPLLQMMIYSPDGNVGKMEPCNGKYSQTTSKALTVNASEYRCTSTLQINSLLINLPEVNTYTSYQQISTIKSICAVPLYKDVKCCLCFKCCMTYLKEDAGIFLSFRMLGSSKCPVIKETFLLKLIFKAKLFNNINFKYLFY